MTAEHRVYPPPEGDPHDRPERTLRHWFTDQRPASRLAFWLGASALALVVLGVPLVVTMHGWVPSSSITEAIESRTTGILGVLAIVLGAAAAIVGWTRFRSMDTRAAREGCVVGAVLGVQAIVYSAVVLWFRGGAVEIFARNFLEFRIVEDALPDFVRGAVNTIILSAAGEGLGIVLGLILALFTLSRRAAVRAPARAYINFFRGTPLIWQVSFFGLGLIPLGFRLNLNPYIIAILVLGLNAGAYTAEIFRAGIQSLERGQFEAARSLGMNYMQAMRYVIVPQAFRRVIPPLTNEFVILIKDTSLVIFLGLTAGQRELFKVGRDMFSATFNATPFLATAAGYLVITLPLIRFVTWLEKRLRSGLSIIG